MRAEGDGVVEERVDCSTPLPALCVTRSVITYPTTVIAISSTTKMQITTSEPKSKDEMYIVNINVALVIRKTGGKH